ncbi:MAG: hypothetical protein GXP16_20160 [Gammaproteobacteria bacterium]|nr:hypothetical protein [Gammaproteobacteria bacterium]
MTGTEADAVIPGMHLTDGMPPRIAYVGPLGRERTLKLDIAIDELVLNTREQGLLRRWPDLPSEAAEVRAKPSDVTARSNRRQECLALEPVRHNRLCVWWGLTAH